MAIYGKLLYITVTHPLTPPAQAAGAPGEAVRYYSRLKVNFLTAQCLLSVVLEHGAIDVAAGLERKLAYHGRYEKRQRQNLWQKFFALA